MTKASENKNIISVPFISVWEGSQTVQTTAKVNIDTGEVTDIVVADVGNGLNGLERQYIVLSGEEIAVHSDENNYDFWADIKGIRAKEKLPKLELQAQTQDGTSEKCKFCGSKEEVCEIEKIPACLQCREASAGGCDHCKECCWDFNAIWFIEDVEPINRNINLCSPCYYKHYYSCDVCEVILPKNEIVLADKKYCEDCYFELINRLLRVSK